MARGFGTTSGVGATDVISTTLTSLGTRSWWILANRRAAHGVIARMWDEDLDGVGVASGSALVDRHFTVANTFDFMQGFNSVHGQWRIDTSSLSNGSWFSIGVSYDTVNIANNPIIYLNGTKLTVGAGITEVSSPSGVAAAGSSSLTIGNDDSGIRAWDGSLAEFVVWSSILDDGEFASLNKRYSPALIRPASLVRYIPMVQANVNLKGAAPSITGTAVQPHPRIIMPAGAM